MELLTADEREARLNILRFCALVLVVLVKRRLDRRRRAGSFHPRGLYIHIFEHTLDFL